MISVQSPQRQIVTKRRTLCLASLGSALEFYDFIVFVFFTGVIGNLFFPASVPDWLRQVETFGIFAAGYRRHGIEPAPERSRKMSWKEFLAQHWGLIVAADFFSVEVWTWKGLKRFLVLFFIDLATRQVEIAGISSAANGFWMSQVGRNATDAVDGILFGKRYLIHDRDPLFTAEFQQLLASVGVKSVKLPRQSPNLNAYAERFVRTIKESCLERLVLFGERSLRTAVREFTQHYLRERHHRGLGNRLILADNCGEVKRGRIQRHQRLGGLLNYYSRAA